MKLIFSKPVDYLRYREFFKRSVFILLNVTQFFWSLIQFRKDFWGKPSHLMNMLGWSLFRWSSRRWFSWAWRTTTAVDAVGTRAAENGLRWENSSLTRTRIRSHVTNDIFTPFLHTMATLFPPSEKGLSGLNIRNMHFYFSFFATHPPIVLKKKHE